MLVKTLENWEVNKHLRMKYCARDNYLYVRCGFPMLPGISLLSDLSMLSDFS